MRAMFPPVVDERRVLEQGRRNESCQEHGLESIPHRLGARQRHEATISLDQEMQRAYAAAETNFARLASVAEAQATPAENSSAEAAVETPVAVISDPQSELVRENEPATDASERYAEPVPVAQSEAVNSVEADVPAPVTAEAL